MSTTIQAILPDLLTSLRDIVVWQDPDRLGGVPCFAGTRVPIKTLFDYLEGGDNIDDFINHFPGVSREQVVGAIRLGKEQLLPGEGAV